MNGEVRIKTIQRIKYDLGKRHISTGASAPFRDLRPSGMTGGESMPAWQRQMPSCVGYKSRESLSLYA